ncbi:GIY-YIG nuclease family protein [Flavivirga spongiicola]|uniref:GIY-YIG nuclease family protein n=1 Tax=Flavivirga spongiicola TaxID=421621 RepID=A0ABU7XQZ5_9FLAO|nr:GIY-YIG nuclease family protein [Flavivirga sp. MEBiC05379]MDO5978204.1 GIY-YIG nuclease family protein [Flavivirga sp. MEBiC05379]
MKFYYVYILLCSDKTYYTGMTNNLERRINQHESGYRKDSYTNLGVKCRIKADVILKSKNAVIRLHNIITEFMNKAFRFKKNEATCGILRLNWY